jgi:hypothetical protein
VKPALKSLQALPEALNTAASLMEKVGNPAILQGFVQYPQRSPGSPAVPDR